MSESIARIFRIADFGASGDGKTDCCPAVKSALSAIREYGGPAVLQFEPNGIYFFASVPENKPAVMIRNFGNLTLSGKNTTFVLGQVRTYVDIQHCHDIKVTGFNFKLFKPVYTLSEVVSVDHKKPALVIRSRDSLEIEGTWLDKSGANFGIPSLLQYGRKHIFYDSIETLDAAGHLYRLNVQKVDNYAEKLKFIEETHSDFITPMPNVGQINLSAFLTTYTTNLTLENCNLWSSSHFSFHMRYNEGVFRIRNTNIVPEPGSDGIMVGWRDGFHIKENRAKFIWEDCTLGGIFDDVWNISCSVLTVREVFGPKEFEMGCMEFGGEYPVELRVGDEIILYDVETGALVGDTHISRVVLQDKTQNRITVEDALPLNRPQAVLACVYSLSNPGAEIHGCKIYGTFRIRCEATIEDTDMDIVYSWVENEPPWEGPIPRNITFRRCRMHGINTESNIMTLGTVSSYSKPISPLYYTKNIVFEDCDMDPSKIFIRSSHDDVKFIRCALSES